MRYIYHISDIHIRLDNEENLEHSLERLVRDILKTPKAESMLVIAGDIFENKTYLNTEEIYIFKKMINKLENCKIRTLIIPGNHDYNINSQVDHNSISILLEDSDYITCLSKTQIYNMDNIDFYIFSPIDKKVPTPVRNGKVRVAVLHEPLNGATWDNGESIRDGRFGARDLTQWDYVMAGDIHKPQFITPRIAYSGSLVQKTKGEGLDHGYILWDIKEGRGKHVFIPLRSVYLKLEAFGNKCKLPELLEDQKVRYVSLYHKNCDENYLDNLRNSIRLRYGNINKIINGNIYETKNIDSEGIESINHLEIFKEKLEEKLKNGMDLDMYNRILEEHNKQLQNRKEINYTRYTLNYMVWNNILCYGEGNCIDFRNFSKSIVLLNAKNKQGKSSIIDILIRILFNECVRGYKDNIINKNKEKGNIKLSFSVGEVEYVIEQVIYKGNKTKLHKLYRYVRGKEENLTKQTIIHTYEYIKNVIGIGDYRDFIKMTTALQHRKFLVDMENREVVSLLTKLLNVDVLHDLEKVARRERNYFIRSRKEYIQDLNKLDKVDDAELKELREKKTSIEEKINLMENKYETINSKIQELNIRKDPTPIPRGLEINIAQGKKMIGDFVCLGEDRKLMDELKIKVNLLRDKIPSGYIYEKLVDPGFTEEECVQRISSIQNNTIKPIDIPKENEEDLQNYINSHKHVDLTSLYSQLRPCTPKEINISKEESKLSEEYLKIEINKLAGLGQREKAHGDLEELRKISLLFSESRDELKQKIKPCDEFRKIEEPRDLGKLKEYKKIISNPLPKYEQVEKEISKIKKKLKIFEEGYGRISYSPKCECCEKNKKIMTEIYDVEEDRKRLKKYEKIFSMKTSTTEKFNNALGRVENIEKYLRQLEQNKIYMENSKINRVINARDNLNRLNRNLLRDKLDRYNLLLQHIIHSSNLKIKENISNLRRENDKLKKYKESLNKIRNYKRWKELEQLRKKLEAVRKWKISFYYEQLIILEPQLLKEEKYFRDYAIYLKLRENEKLNEIRKKNSKLDKLLGEYEILKNKIQDNKNKLLQELKILNEKYFKLKNLSEERTKLSQKIIKNSRDQMFWNEYFSLINHNTGIPKIILNRACKYLNMQCNSLIGQITDFSLEICYNKEFKIYTRENNNLIPATMASGFQKFLMDIVLRIILTRLSVLSNPQCLFLDEGFGCLDRDNFVKVAQTLKKIKNNFKYIFIISHLRELEAYSDIILGIDRKMNNSLLVSGDPPKNSRLIEEIKENNKPRRDMKKALRDEREALKKAETLRKKELRTKETENRKILREKEKEKKKTLREKKKALREKEKELKATEKKRLKEELDKKIDEWFRNNPEGILNIYDDTFTCLACQRDYGISFMNRHLEAKRVRNKHRKYVADILC